MSLIQCKNTPANTYGQGAAALYGGPAWAQLFNAS